MAKLQLQGQGVIITASEEVTVSALAAGAEEELSVSVSGVEVGDVVSVSPSVAVIEAGLSISYAYVDAADSIKIGISNQGGSALAGSTGNMDIAVISDRTV